MKKSVGYLTLLWLGLLQITSAHALTLDSQNLLVESYTAEAHGLINVALEKMVLIYKKEPDDYLAHLRMGWLFLLGKKFKNSIDHYERAAELAPNSLEPLLGLSQSFLAVEDFSKTSAICKRILKLDPGNYLGQQRAAQAFYRLKEFAKGLEITNHALAAYPTDPGLLEIRALSLRQLGRTEEADRAIGSLLLISPSHYLAHYPRGKAERTPASINP